MDVNALAVADIFIFLQGMLLSLLFLSSYKGNRYSNLLLGLFIFTQSFGLLHSFFLNSGLAYKYNWLLGFPSLFLFWHGPLLYFYTLSLTSSDFKWKYTYNWYFLPAAIELIISFILFGLGGNTLIKLAAQEWFWNAAGIEALAGSLYTINFVACSIILVSKNTVAEKLQHITIKWLSYTLYYFLVRSSSVGAYFFVSLLFDAYVQVSEYATAIFTFFTIIDFLAILTISFFSFKYTHQIHTIRKREAAYPFSPAEEHYYFERLTALMEQEKLYRKGDLKLSDVAARLNTNVRYISQLVKLRTNSSFTQYVNTYRIEEVKRHIAEEHYQHLTLTAMAAESGFNSKATFNRVFKEMTGMLPKDYRQKVLR